MSRSPTPPPALAVLRADFARELGLRECKWSRHNLSRLLRATGERPARVAEMKAFAESMA